MAQDGLFFRRLAWVHPRTQVPVYAIVIQSIWTMVIVFSGSYGKILSYVISMDATFWVLTAACLFVIRRRDASPSHFPVPGHPYTTAIFCLACTALVFNTIYKFPRNTLIGVGILVTGIPVYYLWRRTSHR
jgi:APA family basic amino acid/polyamine antiporter